MKGPDLSILISAVDGSYAITVSYSYGDSLLNALNTVERDDVSSDVFNPRSDIDMRRMPQPFD